MKILDLLSEFLICTLLVACGGGKTLITAMQVPSPEPRPTATITSSSFPSVVPSPLPTLTASPTPTLAPDAWQSMPVVPISINERVHEIYQRGQELGNNPNVFSKIGDCDSTPTWFLGDFDSGPKVYALGDYTYLQPVIDNFHGSYNLWNVSLGRGFTAASVLTPFWADPKQCQPNETPLACELRLNHPAFAFVMLGTNDVNHQDVFETYMRQILDTLIEKGVVPILATKADNLEGDGSINATIARLAYEYDIPLWNFWLAVQPLPEHGLQDDHSHLTWAQNYFNDPLRMQAAWPWRNLTALQVLNAVWSGVNEKP